MTAGILTSEVNNMIEDKVRYERMAQNAKLFGKKNAAFTIARALVDTALSHER